MNDKNKSALLGRAMEIVAALRTEAMFQRSRFSREMIAREMETAADVIEAQAEQLSAVTAERDAAMQDLNGMCWCCKNAKPWVGNLVTCEKLSAHGVLANGGRRKCPDWEWRGDGEDEV